MVKKIVNSIFEFIFKKNSALKNKALTLSAEHFKNNTSDFEYFFRELFIAEKERHLSLMNSGYLHINKTIELSRYFNLPPDNLIIDVGAATGITPVFFSKAFPSSIIYAFEPIPDTFNILLQEVAGNKNIYPVNKALGNGVQTIDIHLASRRTSSSLLNIERKVTNEFWKKNLKEEGTEQVMMSKLDIEIPKTKKVNILKIDVQGYELEVLKGGIATLERTAVVLLEMQNHELYIGAPKYYELDEFLRNNNFELYDMIHSIRQEEKIYEWDSIYVNKKFLK